MAPTTDINPTATRQVFISADENHRLVRVPQNEIPVMRNGEATGQARETNPALAYQFEGGVLVIDDARRKEDAKFFDKYRDALSIDDERPAEEWLRAHAHFSVPRGFAEVEYQAANSSEALERIAGLLIEEDVEGLVELYQAEEAGENRPDVLRTAAGAITKLEAQETAPAA